MRARTMRLLVIMGVPILVLAGSLAQPEPTPDNLARPYLGYLTSPHSPGVILANVRIGGQSIGDSAPSLAIRQGHDVAIHLQLAQSIAPSEQLGIRVRSEGSSGIAERTYWIATHDWEVGALREWTGSFRVPMFTLTGRGTLSISQLLPKRPDAPLYGDKVRIVVDEALLFRGPVFVEPSPVNSRVSDELLANAFGNGFVRLNRAVRLSPETTVRVGVTLPAGARCLGLGIVSAMGGGFEVSRGASVLAIELEPPGESITLQAGVDTSFIDRAVPPPGVVRLGSVDAVANPTAPLADWHRRPVNGAIYASERRFDGPAGGVEALMLAYRHAVGFIDVYEIVCLIDAPATP